MSKMDGCDPSEFEELNQAEPVRVLTRSPEEIAVWINSTLRRNLRGYSHDFLYFLRESKRLFQAYKDDPDVDHFLVEIDSAIDEIIKLEVPFDGKFDDIDEFKEGLNGTD